MRTSPHLVTFFFFAIAGFSSALPYDLDIAAPVQISGTDAASAQFESNGLPALLETAQRNMTLSQAGAYLSASSFDPGKLTLAADSTVRIYFVGEGAGNANTLGFSTTGTGPLSPDAALIFPNASSTMGWGGTDRPGWAPLQPGDFVDLGAFKAGTKLDFFLISNGAYGGREIFSTDTSANSDSLVHAMALSSVGSPYLLFNFEDMDGESASVFNDLVFAVEIRSSQARGISTPEPSLTIGAMFFAGFLGFYRQRRAA